MSASRRKVNLGRNIQKYLSDRQAGTRYASFDYCFNYFQGHRDNGRLADLLEGEALQLSCLHLGFYLASWGMFRGSTDLLQRSARHLIPLVRAIASAPTEVWELDANTYGDGNCPAVFDTATRIRAALPGASDTLVTKVMLGTFGSVPAFDTNFKRGFGTWTFDAKALRSIGEFYDSHAGLIERHRVRTLGFRSGKPTKRRYTRARVIDMIFFVAGAS